MPLSLILFVVFTSVIMRFLAYVISKHIERPGVSAGALLLLFWLGLSPFLAWAVRLKPSFHSLPEFWFDLIKPIYPLHMFSEVPPSQIAFLLYHGIYFIVGILGYVYLLTKQIQDKEGESDESGSEA